MRAYERTHPFITFGIDLTKAPTSLWLLLGEAQSKVQHLAGVPMLPEVQKDFMKVYLAKGVLATTAIEGNTLSEDEVRRRIEGTLQLPPSKEYSRERFRLPQVHDDLPRRGGHITLVC